MCSTTLRPAARPYLYSAAAFHHQKSIYCCPIQATERTQTVAHTLGASCPAPALTTAARTVDDTLAWPSASADQSIALPRQSSRDKVAHRFSASARAVVRDCTNAIGFEWKMRASKNHVTNIGLLCSRSTITFHHAHHIIAHIVLDRVQSQGLSLVKSPINPSGSKP